MNVPHGGFSNVPLDLRPFGSRPGALDPSQPARILRDPNATLLFATHDPKTAGGDGEIINMARLTLDEHGFSKPRRVVIEIFPTGNSSWKFVPKARLEGVTDEGLWPRVIEIYNLEGRRQLVHCTQEQWEIYKLDPCYDCVVRAFPSMTSISPKVPETPVAESAGRKRARPDDGEASPLEGPSKKPHFMMMSLTDLDSDNEEDEVAQMITDENYQRPAPGKRFKPASQKSPRRSVNISKPPSQAETLRREPTFRTQSMPPESTPRREPTFVPMDISQANIEMPEEESNGYEWTNKAAKRGGHSRPEDVENRDRATKRARNHIRPESENDTPAHSRTRRVKKKDRGEEKRRRWEEYNLAKSIAREREVLAELMAAVAEAKSNKPSQGSSFGSTASASSSEPSVDAEEAAREAAIAESRRKLQELEADRPIWDAAARERAAQEQDEADDMRRKAEAKKRAGEDRMRAERERQRRAQQEEEERQRKEVQAREEARAKSTREREARRARWNSGRWNTRRAVERFLENNDYFDITRFSESTPLAVEDIPWPTLLHPSQFSPEDVDWASVEQFFDVLRTHLRTQEYISVVEKSHRRFHPDRWRSRNLFKAILDASERDFVEVAATTVSQALTPIWQKVRASKQA